MVPGTNKRKPSVATALTLRLTLCSSLFFSLLHRAEQEAVKKHEAQEEKQRQRALRYANAIRQQMEEQQSSAAARRRRSFQEERQLSSRQQRRRLQLSHIRQEKLQELR